VVNKVGKPLANAIIHVRNDTSGRDIDHDITSGTLAYDIYLYVVQYLAMLPTYVSYFIITTGI